MDASKNLIEENVELVKMEEGKKTMLKLILCLVVFYKGQIKLLK